MLLNAARAMLSAERRALAGAARAEAVHLARAYTNAKKNELQPSDVSCEGITSEETSVSGNNQTTENTLSHMLSREDDVIGDGLAPHDAVVDVGGQTVIAKEGVAHMSHDIGGGANCNRDETPIRSEDSIPSQDNTATPTALGNDGHATDTNRDDVECDKGAHDSSSDVGPTTTGAGLVDGVVGTPPSTLRPSMGTDDTDGSAIDAAARANLQLSLHGDPENPGLASEVPVTADVMVEARIASATGATSEIVIASASVQAVVASTLDGE